MDKYDYIKILSKESDKYGNILIQMMDRYDANNLRDMSEEQVKEFYEDWRIINDRK